MLDNSFWADKPDEVRKSVALIDGVLHMSENLKGSVDMTYLLADLRRQGIVNYEFHQPSDFEEKYARLSARIMVNDNQITVLAKDILARAYKDGATDIHLTDLGSYMQVQFRILGMLSEHTEIEGETGRRLLRVIYEDACTSTDKVTFSDAKNSGHDGRIINRDYLPAGVHSVRVHSESEEVNSAPNGVGSFMTLRLLYDSTSAQGTLAERMSVLGFLPKQIEELQSLTERSGLIVISGPTGHGKSTFLKHIIESMTAARPELAYVSVEDPPEYFLRGVHQLMVVTNEEADGSKRAEAYTSKIARTMRCDTDVLIVGEIRYSAAALSAMDAAMSGHPTWTTTHANNAFGIIPRIEGMLREGNIREPLNALCNPNVLAGLEYQRLIAKLCPECKEQYGSLPEHRRKEAIPRRILDSLKRVLDWEEIKNKVYVRSPEGCEHCKKFGLSGQTVAAEVVALDLEMLAFLRKDNMPEAYRVWREKGNPTYLEHAVTLIRDGIIDPVTATIRLGSPLNYNQWFESGAKR
jgi:type II secretory ATPase GspE/PulE/Tfp pilus assembly ATPase PilB-like protein